MQRYWVMVSNHVSTLNIAHQSFNTDRDKLMPVAIEAAPQGRQKRQEGVG